MRESCLTRIYPYSSKSFMAFSGSLKLSVNSYSEENKSIMVYTVKLLIMNILYMYVSLVYNITCIKLYTCLCYCVASMKKTQPYLYISLICYRILFILGTLQSIWTCFYYFSFKGKHDDMFVWMSKFCFRNQKS